MVNNFFFFFITCMVIGMGGCRITVNTAPGIQLGGGNHRIFGSGVMKTEKRNVDNFTTLKVQQGVHVYITQGESDMLTVIAEDNILPYVETQVSGHTLTVGVTGDNISLSPTQEIRVEVIVPVSMDKLAVSSAGQIVGDGSINVGKLQIDASSAGHVSMDVHGEGVRISASSSAQVKLRGQVEQLSVSASSAAKVYLVANGTLEYSVSSGAVLNYSGEARVTNSSVTSGGRLVH